MCTMQVNGDSSAGNDQIPDLHTLVDPFPSLIHTARPDGYIDFVNLSYAGRARAVIAECSLPRLSADFDRNRR